MIRSIQAIFAAGALLLAGCDSDNDSPVNALPVANAGLDQVARPSLPVTLVGSATDADGSIVAFAWAQTAGTPLVALSGTDSAIASFVAPDVASVTALTFTLTVTDDSGATDTDTVVVTIDPSSTNVPPVVDAGDDVVTDPGSVVTLDGVAVDPDGFITSFAWTQTGGSPQVTLSSTGGRPTFTVPTVTGSPVNLTFTLTAQDNLGAVSSDSVIVTIRPVNALPQASAGADQSVLSGAAVTLTGAATDSDGTVALVSWSQTGGSPTVTLTGANTATAAFTAPSVASATPLTFTLTVTDDDGATASDSVVVTVNPIVGAITGVLTDAPVGGVTFSAQSGPSDTSVVTGVTSPTGGFTFNTGDTITFAAGDIVIAELPAQETITPREIAADIVLEVDAANGADPAPDLEDVASNVFVFFQSLDTDDDPQTITLPNLDSVDLSGLAGVDVTDPVALFNVPPAEFAADLGAVIAAVVDTVPALADVIGVVDQAAALLHAQEQARLLLSGTWRFESERPNGDPVDIAITFFPDGTYLKGGLENGDCAGQGAGVDGDCNGAELGTYEWNALTGEFMTGSPSVNTDGDSGLENIPAGEAALQVAGAELLFYDLVSDAAQCAADAGAFGSYIDGRDACIFAFTRAENVPTTIVGSFLSPREDGDAGPLVLTIERTGGRNYRYILVDATDGTNVPTASDTTDGVEVGTFTLDSSGTTAPGSIVPIVDTNDSAGIDSTGDPTESYQFTIENGRLKLVEMENGTSEGTGFLDRLPLLPRFSATQLVGLSLSPEEFDSDGIPHNDPQLHVFTFFADGTYVLGNVNDERNASDYINGGVGGEIDELGGMEWGDWTLDPTTGQLHVALHKPFSETNGSAGFYEAHPTEDPTQDGLFISEIGADSSGLFVALANPDEPGETLKFRLVPSQANSLVGTWTTFSPTDDPAFEPEVITFFSDGSMLAASTRGFNTLDSEAGVERFQWSLNPAGDQFTSTRSLNAYPFCVDTVGPGNSCTENGGAGETSTTAFSLGLDGRTATFGTGPSATVLRKVSVP